MSAENNRRLLESARRVLEDQVTERIWLYRQLGLSWEKISSKVGISPNRCNDRYVNRLLAAANWHEMETQFLRNESSGF